MTHENTIQMGLEETIEASLDSIERAIIDNIDWTAELEASLPLDWNSLGGQSREEWFVGTLPTDTDKGQGWL